jgi:SAM-dependent methyltransferase
MPSLPGSREFMNRIASFHGGFQNPQRVDYSAAVQRSPASMLSLKRIRNGLREVRLREFSCGTSICPFCGPSLFVRLNRSASGIRCIRCAASSVHLSIGLVLRREIGSLSELDVCEFSASGPLVDYLKNNTRKLALSEYHEHVEPGGLRNGTRHEDMQQLSYPDHRFDLVTHTEVLEHVPDDRRALAELFRVIKPGGRMVFTVPLSGLPSTTERACLRDGRIEYLLPAVHHVDPWRKGSGILAYRDYGTDIEGRLLDAGFSDVSICHPQHRIPWLQARAVISARAGRPV